MPKYICWKTPYKIHGIPTKLQATVLLFTTKPPPGPQTRQPPAQKPRPKTAKGGGVLLVLVFMFYYFKQKNICFFFFFSNIGFSVVYPFRWVFIVEGFQSFGWFHNELVPGPCSTGVLWFYFVWSFLVVLLFLELVMYVDYAYLLFCLLGNFWVLVQWCNVSRIVVVPFLRYGWVLVLFWQYWITSVKVIQGCWQTFAALCECISVLKSLPSTCETAELIKLEMQQLPLQIEHSLVASNGISTGGERSCANTNGWTHPSCYEHHSKCLK